MVLISWPWVIFNPCLSVYDNGIFQFFVFIIRQPFFLLDKFRQQ